MLDRLFKMQQTQIDGIQRDIDNTRSDSNTVGLAYSFIKSTLAEANATVITDFECRIITNARKSGEGAGLGTGLPAFFDPNSSSWLDFSGAAITS